MAQATACYLPYSNISLAGQRCWRIQVPRLSRLRYASRLTFCLLFMFIPTPRCSRSVLAAIPARPAPPAPATSLTDMARATSLFYPAAGTGMALRLVDPAAELNQHRPVLIAFRYRVLIRLVLLGWRLALWRPVRFAWYRSA